MTVHDSTFEVGLEITTVPDGFASADRCRLSLRVVPRPKPSAGEVRVDIRHWPKQISALVARLAVSPLGNVNGELGAVDPMYGPCVRNELHAHEDYADWVNRADAAWRRIFAPDAENDSQVDAAFKQFLLDLGEAQGHSAAVADLRLDVPEYSESALADVLTNIYARAIASDVVHRLAADVERVAANEAASRGDASRAQQARNLQREMLPLRDDAPVVDELGTRKSVSWWRHQHDEWFAPPVDDVQDVASDAVQPSLDTPSIATRASALHDAARFFGLDENAAPTVPLAVRQNLRQEFRNFRRALGIGDERKTAATEGADAASCEEDGPEGSAPAIAKLSALLASPTLAKFFHLIVDVAVDRTVFAKRPTRDDGRSYGLVAAELRRVDDCSTTSRPAPGELQWTAAVLGPSVAGQSEYFGPCGREEATATKPDPSHEFRDGVINLGVKLANKTQRFRLITEDLNQAFATLLNDAAAIRQAEAEGMPASDQSTRLPERKGGSITLLDELLTQKHKEEVVSSEKIGTVSFAEDLLEGYRVDVALLPKGDTCESGWRSESRWRPLVAMDIRFPNEKQVHPGFVRAIASVSHRDDGRVSTPAGIVRGEKVGDTSKLVIDHRVFSWRGESLAVPSLQHDDRVDGDDAGDREVVVDATKSLAIDMTYSVPREKDNTKRCPPPLRECRAYMIGLRARWMNGCGPTHDEAVARYIAFRDSVVLGESTTKPYTFVRHDEIAAPDILLPWDDRLVKADDPAREAPGESIDTLVVRSGVMETQSTRRILLPGRTSFDAAEQAGVFDFRRRWQPLSAFTRTVRFRTAEETGAFPIARDGRWMFPQRDDSPSSGTVTSERSRGTVFVLDQFTGVPAKPYFPDALARDVCARFVSGEAAAANYGTLETPMSFWDRGGHASDAVPIVLELRRAQRPSADSGHYGWFFSDASTPVEQLRGAPLNFSRLGVSLSPGEEVELELWSLFDTTCDQNAHITLAQGLPWLAAQRTHFDELPSFLGFEDQHDVDAFSFRLSRLISPGENGRRELQKLLCVSPLPQLANRRRVRLVHAVDRPLESPTTSAEAIAAVVLTVEPADPNRDPNLPPPRSWDRYVREHHGLPYKLWTSEPNGTTTFFIGSVRLHRPSTGKLRCLATWREFEPGGVQWDRTAKCWRFRAREVAQTQLFGIDHVEMRDDLRGKPLDLQVYDSPPTPDQWLRGVSYSFPNSKARRLRLRFVGTSRFTEYFPPETGEDRRTSSAGDVGEFERESEPIELWVQSTVRPRPPEIDRVMPVFRWATTGSFHSKRISWTRESSIRIYLPADSWHSSGEGERLAVVFGPTAADFCVFDQRVGDFGSMVTRWGTDPIHRSYSLADLITPSHVSAAALTDPREEKQTEPDNPGTEHGLRLPYGLAAEVTGVLGGCSAGERLPAGSQIFLYGENFIKGATARVNDELAREVRVINSREAVVVLAKDAACPITARVINPDLEVSINHYAPRIHCDEGLWYCDLNIDHGSAYFPFVQLGLVRYQKNSVTDQELSPPISVWAQIPPKRSGSVTFEPDRRILIEHRGVGYGFGPNDPLADVPDLPRLNLRLLRASSPGRLPPDEHGAPAWSPVLDAAGAPMEKLHLRPAAHKAAEVWWVESFTLPPFRVGVRYGLLIEEVELMQGDPDPAVHPDAYRHDAKALSVETVEVERGPMFGHIVDLGE